MPAVGIGGVFFRANDPEALQSWYGEHLGVVADETGQWMQQAGPTVFMPFPSATDYFPAGKQWMLNFRVTEIGELIAALREAGIEVATDPAWDTPETGRFARIHDPEGNAVELWEPPAE
ncbi:MAG TPA: VOC family protein [Caulobacteraceae bacterium]|nr:VOC family protein [Caulobacteraceae bacterium]